MRISIGQIGGGPDKAANLDEMAGQVKRAADDGASLIVFPEMAMWFNKGMSDAFSKNAETIPGPFTVELDRLAKEHSLIIAAGMAETLPGQSRVHNTIYVASPSGSSIGVYRKVHLYDAFGLRESDVVAPSMDMEPMVFDVDGMRVGLMTCYDLRFPESARFLVDAGAEVLLLPSLWTPGVRKEDHWDTLVRARAIENTAYVVACNLAAPISTGASMVVDPMGIVVAQFVEGAEVRTIEISKDRVNAVRQTNPCLVNRRFRVERLVNART